MDMCLINCINATKLAQWRTEEGIRGGGLEHLSLAYDLRNKRVRMRQNMVFSTKNTTHFLGRGHTPSQTLPPIGEGAHPPRLLRHVDPSHSKILGTPLS